MVHAAWDLSNETLWVEESRLTYFTVRDTLKLQMKQEKEKRKTCSLSLHRTKSLPVYTALIKPSGEWHFPAPAVKHGPIHMLTNTNGRNGHKCLDPCGSLCLSLTLVLVPFNTLTLHLCVWPLHITAVLNCSEWNLPFDMTRLWVQVQY